MEKNKKFMQHEKIDRISEKSEQLDLENIQRFRSNNSHVCNGVICNVCNGK